MEGIHIVMIHFVTAVAVTEQVAVRTALVVSRVASVLTACLVALANVRTRHVIEAILLKLH